MPADLTILKQHEAVEPGRVRATRVRFGSFVLDPANQQLASGDGVVSLRPRTMAVLRYLVQKRPALVSKSELLDAVWPDIAVSEQVLSVCVSELRQALGDSPRAPQYIETAHKHGYRFVAPVREEGARGGRAAAPCVSPGLSPCKLVGREAALRQLEECFQRALNGERQMVFVTGEPGIGKTAVVDAFVAAAAPAAIWRGRGSCVQHYGSAEAYLPLLQALTRLVQQPGAERFVALAREHLPSWLAQIPGVMSPAERHAPAGGSAGVTRERMLRELAMGLEVISQATPMLLALEDLHWSDPSTVSLLAALAASGPAARFMVIGTYRPVEVILADHPLRWLRQELDLRRQCIEIALDPVSPDDVARYIDLHFAPQPAPRGLAPLLYRHSRGNPLFMALVAEELLGDEAAGTDLNVWMPRNLRRLIQRQLDALAAGERRLLEAACVAGVEFTAAAVAALTGDSPEAVDAGCAQLVRRHILQFAPAEHANGNGYAFRHSLHQELLSEQLAPQERARLYQAMKRT